MVTLTDALFLMIAFASLVVSVIALTLGHKRK